MTKKKKNTRSTGVAEEEGRKIGDLCRRSPDKKKEGRNTTGRVPLSKVLNYLLQHSGLPSVLPGRRKREKKGASFSSCDGPKKRKRG